MKIFKNVIRLLVVMSISLILINPVQARDLKASLGYVPMLCETPDKGILPDLLKAMDEIYTDGKIIIDVYPPPRAIDNVVKGSHDFFLPGMKSTAVDKDALLLRFSETLWTSIFVLYANKNVDIDMNNLGNYKIETNPAVTGYFDFPVLPFASTESSLKKVDIGRIDGLIYAMGETDSVLKRLGLKNVKRIYYEAFEGPIMLAKGPKGDEVEKILLPLIKELRDNGTYAKIMAPMLNQQFVEW